MQDNKTIKNYKSLLKASDSEIVINKSRFIASCSPVSSEEEALDFIASIKQRYKAATHYCYAYIIGENSGIMRYSDDGEPSGTAGMPILQVLEKNKLVNVCAVVTRYFGGTLLGAGGLVRAYTNSTSEGIKKSVIVCMETSVDIYMQIPYSSYDKISYQLGLERIELLDTQYSDSISIKFSVREADKEALLNKLSTIMNGNIFFDVSEAYNKYWQEG